MPVVNNCIKFVKRPGLVPPTADLFSYEECDFPEVSEGQVLLKTLYLAVDPVSRFQLNEKTGVSGIEPWAIGCVPAALNGVGEVLESKSEKFKTGDIVINNGTLWPWQKYWTTNANFVAAVEASEAEYQLSYYGISGLTALLGLTKDGHIGGCNESKNCVVISGAAGSVGHLAGQFALVYGCHPVIGICGSDEKCEILRSKLNFTNTINYKKENVEEKIKEFCPNGVDFYYDNVGGDISNAVVTNMNPNGYISVVGSISQYHSLETYSLQPSEFISNQIKQKDISRQVFMVLSEAAKWSEGLKTLYSLKHDKGVQVLQTVYEGLDNLPKAFCDMFGGKNIGKMMVKL